MKPIIAHPSKPPYMSWPLDVTESRQPLSDNNPIWVRHGVVQEGPSTPVRSKY